MNLNFYNSITKKYLKELGFYLSIALLVGLVPGTVINYNSARSNSNSHAMPPETYVANPAGDGHFEMRAYKEADAPGNLNINDSARKTVFEDGDLQTGDKIIVEGWMYTNGGDYFNMVSVEPSWNVDVLSLSEDNNGTSSYPGNMLDSAFRSLPGDANSLVLMNLPKSGATEQYFKLSDPRVNIKDSVNTSANDPVRIFKIRFKVTGDLSNLGSGDSLVKYNPDTFAMTFCDDTEDNCATSTSSVDQTLVTNGNDIISYNSTSGGTCAAGEVLCGDTCVNTHTDPNHCGGCDGDVCEGGETCFNDSCEDITPIGLKLKLKVSGNLDDYNQNPLGHTFLFDEYDVKSDDLSLNESRKASSNPPDNTEFNEEGELISDVLLTKGHTYTFTLKPHAPYVAQNPFNFDGSNLDTLVVQESIPDDTVMSTLTVDFGEICLGDLNGDKKVDSLDAAIITGPDVFYKPNIDFDSGDLNRDGVVNTYDWSIVNRCNYLATEN